MPSDVWDSLTESARFSVADPGSAATMQIVKVLTT